LTTTSKYSINFIFVLHERETWLLSSTKTYSWGISKTKHRKECLDLTVMKQKENGGSYITRGFINSDPCSFDDYINED
jgi:hypothetical protein